MLSWIGNAVAALGAALVIASLWVRPYDVGPKLWDDKLYSIYYLTIALATVLFLVLGAVTRQRIFLFVGMALALVTCGSGADSIVLTHRFFDGFEPVRAGFWLQPIGGLILAAGGILAYVGHGFEPTLATQPVAPERASASREEEAPASVPAGWYPNPAGGGGQRYWDGSRWTDATQ
jgi:hypothetical protein